MKTISLSDEAYERLLAWKDSPKDSFSSVVLKTVPKRGTLADLGKEIDKLPPLTEELPLLTRNVSEFSRVPDLRVEDYTEADTL